MSLFHLAVTAVATPVPTPTPQVIKEVLTNTIKVPENIRGDVLNLASTLGLALAVAIVSFIHQLTIKDKWAGNIQRLIVAGYSLIAAFVTAALNGHVGVSVNDINIEVTSLLVALGAAFSRYEFLFKAIVAALHPTAAPGTPVVTPPLAVESEQAVG